MSVSNVKLLSADANAKPVVQASIDPTTQKTMWVVRSDQSTFKGLVWGLGFLQLAPATLGFATATLYSSLLIGTNLAALPVVCATATWFTGWMTVKCFENAAYHLGSREIIVLR